MFGYDFWRHIIKYFLIFISVFLVSCASTRTYTEVNFEKSDESIAYEETTVSAEILDKKPNFEIIAFDAFCVPFVFIYSSIKGIYGSFVLPMPYGMYAGWEKGAHMFEPKSQNMDLQENERMYQKKLEKYSNTKYYDFRKVVPHLSVSTINGELYRKTYYFDGKTKESKSNVRDLRIKDTVKDTVGRVDANVNIFIERTFRFITIGLSAPFYIVGWLFTGPLFIVINTYCYITDEEFRNKVAAYKEEKKNKKERLIVRRKKYYRKR